jgi:FAD synthetase
MVKKVLCAGTFDHFHLGHVDFLKQAKSLGDTLIVVVARDETVRRIKGFSPTYDEQQRKSKVEGAGVADKVIFGNLDTDIFHIINEVNPDVIALGYDQRVSESELTQRFPGSQVVRLAPFYPEKYKASFFRDNELRR